MRGSKALNKRYSASSEEIQTEYFQWLCGLVNLDRGYWILARKLHDKEFYWTVPNDDNRASDGQKLRDIFEDETLYSDYSCLSGGCSVLEMLIGLAIRIEDILYDPDNSECLKAHDAFWEMLENLGLEDFDDMNYSRLNEDCEVDEILLNLLERTYDRSGRGGLFPLKKAREDQRRVEIWYQMSTYLLENY